MAGIPKNGMTLVGMGHRPRAGLDFEAVRTAIGTRATFAPFQRAKRATTRQDCRVAKAA